jgi:uncharacterized protein YbaA (DUF1428 family)
MYVDGFVIPVPRAKLDDYFAMARSAGEVWKKHGALQYIECVGDDVPIGEVTSFPRSVKANDDEVVVFSWITFPSREARDRINVAAMAELGGPPADMPFDAQRMIFGGFRAQVEL